MRDLDPNQSYIFMLQQMLDRATNELRKAHQEMQQWEDETCLEIDELDSIIDGHQAHIKELWGMLQDAAKQSCVYQAEIDNLKRHLSDVYDKNRRLCLDLESAEQDAQNRYDQAVEQFKNCERTHVRLDTWREEHNRANKAEQEAADARAAADNATLDAINCRRANDSLLDINQTLSAKLVAIEQALNPCPTPQQGETVPPRPMWSRYRRE
jgi:chromosome segregation ATPase